MSRRSPLATAETPSDTGTRDSSGKTSELLTSLANCCQVHHTHHERERLPGDPVDEEEDVPSFCGDALRALSAILPKVERSIRNQARPNPDILVKLCDFYDQVTQGAFCPHAPHLFKRGKDAAEGNC